MPKCFSTSIAFLIATSLSAVAIHSAHASPSTPVGVKTVSDCHTEARSRGEGTDALKAPCKQSSLNAAKFEEQRKLPARVITLERNINVDRTVLITPDGLKSIDAVSLPVVAPGAQTQSKGPEPKPDPKPIPKQGEITHSALAADGKLPPPPPPKPKSVVAPGGAVQGLVAKPKPGPKPIPKDIAIGQPTSVLDKKIPGPKPKDLTVPGGDLQEVVAKPKPDPKPIPKFVGSGHNTIVLDKKIPGPKPKPKGLVGANGTALSEPHSLREVEALKEQHRR